MEWTHAQESSNDHDKTTGMSRKWGNVYEDIESARSGEERIDNSG